MSDLHALGANIDPATLEQVGEGFVKQGLLQAREKTIQLLKEIQAELKEGLTEDEARKLAMKIALDHHGIKKHWHKCYIRFGSGTLLTFNDPLQPDYRLQPDDPYYLDLGPVWRDDATGIEYEGDYGDTFVFGKNIAAEKSIATVHELFEECREKWKSERISGQDLYRFLNQRASARGYDLVKEVDGHRVSDFPHHRFTKGGLGEVSFVPSDTIWILEVMIREPNRKFGAFFEDLL